MNKILVAAAVVALSSTSVFAADLAARPYTKAPPAPVAPIYNWTGLYVGAFVGGAFSGSNGINDPLGYGFVRDGNSNSFFGGGQLGYNYQFAPNWVLGIEGDIGGLDYKRTYVDNIGPDFIRQKSDWLASVTGRLGYTWGPGMLYVKGGAAFRDKSFSSSYIGYSADSKDTGYTIGGGLEYMFAPAWSAKIEYQYYDFGKTNVFDVAVPGSAIASYKNDLHTVKAGINYHFNWGGPIVARY